QLRFAFPRVFASSRRASFRAAMPPQPCAADAVAIRQTQRRRRPTVQRKYSSARSAWTRIWFSELECERRMSAKFPSAAFKPAVPSADARSAKRFHSFLHSRPRADRSAPSMQIGETAGPVEQRLAQRVVRIQHQFGNGKLVRQEFAVSQVRIANREKVEQALSEVLRVARNLVGHAVFHAEQRPACPRDVAQA